MDLDNHSEYSKEILEKIKELELELSEGDITEKGFIKKKALLLQKYNINNNNNGNNRDQRQNVELIPDHNSSHSHGGGANVHPAAADLKHEAPMDPPVARKKDGRRYTRDESRYRSDIREEAVREALARHKGQEALVPSKRKDPLSVSSEDDPKRISGLGGPSFRTPENRLQEHDSDSEDDDEDDTTNVSSDGSTRHKIKSTDLPSGSHKSPRISRRDAAAASSSSVQPVNFPRPQPRPRVSVVPKDNEAGISSNRQSRFQNGC